MYAKKSDLKLTDIRRRQIHRFQKNYRSLILAVQKSLGCDRGQILLELTMRSSVINKYDRVTGNSISFIVQKVQKLRPKLRAEELYQLAKVFSSYQDLNPERKKIQCDVSPRHKNIMQNLYSIVRECREGI
jgi:hypothetical protein